MGGLGVGEEMEKLTKPRLGQNARLLVPRVALGCERKGDIDERLVRDRDTARTHVFSCRFRCSPTCGPLCSHPRLLYSCILYI